jgi:hypothetical protein
MRLLKKDIHFIWDERARESFNSLKKSLVSTPLLKSLDYSRDYFLYVTMYEETIGMLLVQEDDELRDHVLFYLSRNIVSPELKYCHVEKICLDFIHVVQ